MMKEKVLLETYLDKKRKTIVEIVDDYNCNIARNKDAQFKICEPDFDLGQTFCTSDICMYCGNCCRTFPCVFSPHDFLDLNDLDYMRKILDTGLICISKSPYDELLILRPRGDADFGRIVSFSEHTNTCLLLSKDGCMLSPELRPTQGLLFLPHNGEHIAIYSTKKYEQDYVPYQNSLKDLYEEYHNVRSTNFEITTNQVKTFTKILIGCKK